MMPAATIAGRRSRALPGLLAAALLPLLPAAGKTQEETPGELPPLAGYATRLRLDTPIHAGSARTVTGSGAPTGNGIWVELWRILGPGRVESIGSVAAANGGFTFTGVDVAAGEALFATLSRSWHFRTPGDLEGWGASTNDAVLRVDHGVLELEIEDLNGDGVLDPWTQAFFPFNPRHYRVVEIRLLNPSPSPTEVSLFWGSPWPARVGEHPGEIPHAMTRFQTIQFPMNVDELRIAPAPVLAGQDGLWDRGTLNDTLRIDPLSGDVSTGGSSLEGLVFLIDTIRIREDYRRDFHRSGDLEGLLTSNDAGDLGAAGGFLAYTAADVGSSSSPGADGAVDPFVLGRLAAGRLDTSYFTRFAIGMENERVAVDPLVLGIFFDDQDSRSYRDNGGAGPLQRGALSLPAVGRHDEARAMNALSGNEWTEDGGRIPADTLRLDCPEGGREGDRIRIDYFGWIPDNPHGPSLPVLVENPPVAGVPRATLGFAGPCGQAVEGASSAPYSAALACTLTTLDNPLPQGAWGWSISLGAEGVVITGITTRGTVAADVGDNPPGLRNDGFELSELTAGPGNEGAVSAVVLSFRLPVTLPAAGTQTIARLTVEGTFPAAGTLAARVHYAGGRQGSGLPVDNAASFLGHTVVPLEGECAFELVVPGSGNLWPTYDCQGDGQMDISDAVCHLNFLFLGGPAPACPAALNFNGDGGIDISDPVAELNFLFLGGPPPARGTGCRLYDACPRSPRCP